MDDLERLLRSLFHVAVMGVSQEIGLSAERALKEALQKRDLGGIIGSAFIYGGSLYAFRSSGRKLSHLLGNPRTALPSFYHLSSKTRQGDIQYLRGNR